MPWKDVDFHGTHVGWKKGLDITTLNIVAHWICYISIFHDMHQVHLWIYIIKQVFDAATSRMCSIACQSGYLFTIHFYIAYTVVYIYILANWKHKATSCKSSWGVTR